MPTAEGEPDAIRLSLAAAAPTPEALFRFKRPDAQEAVQAATSGAPGSDGFQPRREGAAHSLTAAPSTEVLA